MERPWLWKFIAVVVLMVASVLYLVPSLQPELPDWYKEYVTNKKLSLGLDLQGGVHIVLGVETDKAILDFVDRQTEDIYRYCEDEELKCQLVNVVDDEPALYVTFADNDAKNKGKKSLDKWLKNVMQNEGAQPGEENSIRYSVLPEYAKHRADYAVMQAIETIRNRIDETGVREPLVARQGESSILIQMPGVKDLNRVQSLIGRVAQLEFKVVDDKGMELAKHKDNLPKGWSLKYESATDKNGTTHQVPYLEAVKDKEGESLASFKEWVKAEDRVPADRELLLEELEKDKSLTTYYRSYTLYKRTLMTGDTIADAGVNIDQQNNRPYVSLTFDQSGAKQFAQVTEDHTKERMAIVLDNTVYSAPVIQGRIGGGRAMITLGSLRSYQELFNEARDLVVVLRAGALPAPVKFEETRFVGPTLGNDSIASGKLSMIIGFSLVMIFMLVYYRMAGVFANLALMLNVLFIMAAMAGFEATLTLPGIAGIVLTIGMAVDANVIIYERLREEQRIGKTPIACIESGYDKAFWTIFDAQVTTMIAGFVLWSYGTGPVKGFAVTLIIGIISSMFTAIVVSRAFFEYVTMKFKPQTLSV